MYFKDDKLVIEDVAENIKFMNLVNGRTDKEIVDMIKEATEDFNNRFRQTEMGKFDLGGIDYV